MASGPFTWPGGALIWPLGTLMKRVDKAYCVVMSYFSVNVCEAAEVPEEQAGKQWQQKIVEFRGLKQGGM